MEVDHNERFYILIAGIFPRLYFSLKNGLANFDRIKNGWSQHSYLSNAINFFTIGSAVLGSGTSGRDLIFCKCFIYRLFCALFRFYIFFIQKRLDWSWYNSNWLKSTFISTNNNKFIKIDQLILEIWILEKF